MQSIVAHTRIIVIRAQHWNFKSDTHTQNSFRFSICFSVAGKMNVRTPPQKPLFEYCAHYCCVHSMRLIIFFFSLPFFSCRVYKLELYIHNLPHSDCNNRTNGFWKMRNKNRKHFEFCMHHCSNLCRYIPYISIFAFPFLCPSHFSSRTKQ